MILEARCRTCGNTGYEVFMRPCKCKVGQALAQMAAAGLGNAPFPVDAFKSASDGPRANRRTYEYLVQRCGQLLQENATLWSFVRVAATVEDWPDWTVAQIMDGAKDLADQARALLAEAEHEGHMEDMDHV